MSGELVEYEVVRRADSSSRGAYIRAARNGRR
jgi:hypothetical protein